MEVFIPKDLFGQCGVPPERFSGVQLHGPPG